LADIVPGDITSDIDAIQPLITSSDWNVVANTSTVSAKSAILPALGIMTIAVGVPVAKKVFKKVAN